MEWFTLLAMLAESDLLFVVDGGSGLTAERGDAAEQCNLGLMYEHGRGVRTDKREAVRLYRLAADQGHAYARAQVERLDRAGQGGK